VKAVLDGLLSRLPGALGVAIVGLDGLPVESVTSGPGVNMDVVSAEGIGLVRRSGWSPSGESAEKLQEIALTSPSRLTIFRDLGSGYFLCVVTGPGTLPGQARYEAWRTGLLLREVIG